MFRWSAFVLLIGFSAYSWAVNQLTDVSTRRLGDDFIVEMTFQDDVSDKDVNIGFVKSTIEVNLKNATAPTTKMMTHVKDDLVDHLFTAITGKDTLRSRVILSKGMSASKFKNSTSVLSRANKLFVKISPSDKAAASAVTSAALVDQAVSPELIDKLMQSEAQTKVAPKEEMAVVAPQLSEESQPVFKNPPAVTKEAGTKSLLMRLFFALAVTAGVGGCGFLVYKRWPAAQKRMARNRMIEVLAQHPLGSRKSLAVVRVAGESVLIGVTDNNITILRSLTLLDDDVTKSGFEKTLASKESQTVPAEVEEEFSMKGLKEILGDRLKSMKEL